MRSERATGGDERQVDPRLTGEGQPTCPDARVGGLLVHETDTDGPGTVPTSGAVFAAGRARELGAFLRAGDRGRTGDVQLGKLSGLC